MTYPDLFIDYCVSIGMRLTSLRKYILFILWQIEKPLKAYEILHALQQSKQNSKAPTVYRVLDYFVAHGIVHKIESIQSYTLCTRPKNHLASEILMVCNRCHIVRETYDSAVITLIKKLSEDNFFSLGEGIIELKGICFACKVLSRG